MKKRMRWSRKWLAMLLSGMMAFSYFFMLIPSEASAGEDSLTVAEAIASNSGNESVEGIIVGYATGGGSGGLRVSTTATGDTNLVLADSAGETDTSRMLPVQLTSSYRSAFGLQSNPEHIGKKVKITGSLEPYFGVPGLKSPSAIDFVPHDGSGKKVLFDHAHGQTAGAADWVIDGAFSDFADGLRADGFVVDALERDIPFDFSEPAITLDELQSYDVFIIGEPNIPFKTSEQDAMLDYVQNGGSIFFIGDHYNADRNFNRWDSTEIFNGFRRGAYGDPTKGMSSEEANSGAMQDVTSTDWLGDNFGIRFRFNALGDIVSGQTVVAPSESFGITDGITTVESHAGGTLVILDPTITKGLIYMPENPPAWGPAVDQGVYQGGGIDEGPFAAIAKVGLGKAAFIGDSSPVEDATPKYVREENGAKKKTYDGFLEADNGEFLIQTVRWLAHQEDYTSFAGMIPLSSNTPLLNMEHPANTTEPQPEPWSNPSGGYKWYDSTTYAAGSYGSGAEEPGEVVIPGIISIEDARAYPVNTTVTVEGTITSTPGAWGGQGFYLQDATAGIYIFPDNSGYVPGQRVEVTGVVTLYNGELELTDVEIEQVGTDSLPEPQVVSSLDESNQGQVVKFERVIISDIEEVNQYGTLELYAEDEDTGIRTLVRIDNRTGVTYDSFTAQYSEGDKLELTGISSIFNGTYQLKPRWAADIAPAQVGVEEDWIAIELIDGIYGGAEYMAAYVRERQQDNPNMNGASSYLPGKLVA